MKAKTLKRARLTRFSPMTGGCCAQVIAKINQNDGCNRTGAQVNGSGKRDYTMEVVYATEPTACSALSPEVVQPMKTGAKRCNLFVLSTTWISKSLPKSME